VQLPFVGVLHFKLDYGWFGSLNHASHSGGMPDTAPDFSADLCAFIAREGADLVTDSRAVALAFGKRHKHVLRAIEHMRANSRPLIAEHCRLNFEPTLYRVPGPNGAMREETMYKMTAKGLSELSMGFSGDDAREIRIRFLNAFEEVSHRLENAEKSITAQLLALEKREVPSRLKGQIGSRLMHERRREKPLLAIERAHLMELAQPALFH